jgi:glycosyltransferase involved in cell wall biosynthesis
MLADHPKFPKISIVTPSLNQAAYLQDTIQSVLSQDYPDLEYIVVDGGSSDTSVEVLRRFGSDLCWTSEPDNGQYDAVNKGFRRSTGEIMGWLNSDDVYVPRALATVADVFREVPEAEWITSNLAAGCNDRGQIDAICMHRGFDRASFFCGANLDNTRWQYGRGFIQQESTFWRRSLWERAGGLLDTTYSLAGDFELWARFFKHAQLYGVDAVIGVFRSQPNQRSLVYRTKYLEEAERALHAHGGTRYGPIETKLRQHLTRPLAQLQARNLLPSQVVIMAPVIKYTDGEWRKVEQAIW